MMKESQIRNRIKLEIVGTYEKFLVFLYLLLGDTNQVTSQYHQEIRRINLVFLYRKSQCWHSQAIAH